MSDQTSYLTETILTIQHEVQTALDYIETVAVQEASQLGSALSLITIDNLRIRIPLVMEAEQQTGPITTERPQIAAKLKLSLEELSLLKGQLQARQGLLLETQTGNLGKFAKIKVSSPLQRVSGTASTAETPAAVQSLTGEIELNFVRVPREFPQTTSPSTATGGEPPGNIVPVLTGLTIDEASTLLKRGGWSFEAHAASKEDIAAVREARPGTVLKQDPAAGQQVDKPGTTLRFWAALSNISVAEIDGIGETLANRLAKIGITTVGQLSLGQAAAIAKSLHISQTRVQNFIDMAALMSQLSISGLRDEIVELLVRGAGIRSLPQMADTNPTELYRLCNEKISLGKIQVPRSFSFTINDVEGWIKAARSYLKVP